MPKLLTWGIGNFRSLRLATLAPPIFAVSGPILKPRKLWISPETELYREHNFWGSTMLLHPTSIGFLSMRKQAMPSTLSLCSSVSSRVNPQKIMKVIKFEIRTFQKVQDHWNRTSSHGERFCQTSSLYWGGVPLISHKTQPRTSFRKSYVTPKQGHFSSMNLQLQNRLGVC